MTDGAEPDLEAEATVDKFIDWVSNLRVWADEEGFSWSKAHGFYAEKYDGDTDAVLVPGQVVMDWRKREGVDDDLNLSKELRDRGIMAGVTDRKQIGSARRRAWPIDAEVTPHTAETAHRVEERDDSGERPEGLR